MKAGHQESIPAHNPILPPWDYIPDGEPRVFGDRVYLYGSHDRFGGFLFCLDDYVCWSAPVNNLGDWRYEGVIWRKNQDPANPLGLRLLFAPDLVQGPDGRFYLYYALDFMGLMGVAVADSPVGPFAFHGRIHHPDGRPWGRKQGDSFPFDPGVLVDGGRIWLYSGFSRPVPRALTGWLKLRQEGGYVLELEPDMVTIRQPERLLFPKEGPGSFPGHEFFEASSIRTSGDRYYFVYSSRVNHELCHAVSDRPDGGFAYAGVLVSNGDIGLPGHPDEARAANYTGNNHGGLLELDGRWHIFYHRHTNRSSYSRQACAEVMVQRPDGTFCQAEMTSRGLGTGPLPGIGTFPASWACTLRAASGTGRYDHVHPRRAFRSHPYLTQEGKIQYLANLRDGAVAGFKYFALGPARRIRLSVRGHGTGRIEVSTSPDISSPQGTTPAASLPVDITSKVPIPLEGDFTAPQGNHPLYFRYHGTGAVDFFNFSLS